MTRNLANGFVITVAWSCKASVEGATALHGGKFTYENSSEQLEFIPYDELTEEIVLGWVYTALGSQKVEIEASLEAKVAKQLSFVYISGLPWVP